MQARVPQESASAESQGFFVDLLPTELLFHVLSFVEAQDLLFCCLVCRSWREVANNNSLWKHLFHSTWSSGQKPYLCLHTDIANLHVTNEKSSCSNDDLKFSSSSSHSTKDERAQRNNNDINWKEEYLDVLRRVPKRSLQVLPNAHQDEVWACAWNREGTLLSTTSKAGTLSLWSLCHSPETGSYYLEHSSTATMDQPVVMFDWSPNGKYILTTCVNHQVHLWYVMVCASTTTDSTTTSLIHAGRTDTFPFDAYARWTPNGRSFLVSERALRAGSRKVRQIFFDSNWIPDNDMVTSNSDEVKAIFMEHWQNPFVAAFRRHTRYPFITRPIQCPLFYHHRNGGSERGQQEQQKEGEGEEGEREEVGAKTVPFVFFSASRPIDYLNQLVCWPQYEAATGSIKTQPSITIYQDNGANIGGCFCNNPRFFIANVILFISPPPKDEQRNKDAEKEDEEDADGGDDIKLSVERELHVWDLEKERIVKVFKGQRIQHLVDPFLSWPSITGDDKYVAVGTEDNRVLFYHFQQMKFLGALSGHHKLVNCVAWHPSIDGLLASVSDDASIILWGA
ncbi:F-box only protein 3 [Balamuthia mandrillaris]